MIYFRSLILGLGVLGLVATSTAADTNNLTSEEKKVILNAFEQVLDASNRREADRIIRRAKRELSQVRKKMHRQRRHQARNRHSQ